jgi:hypothetical protein
MNCPIELSDCVLALYGVVEGFLVGAVWVGAGLLASETFPIGS